eukprot:629260-Amphidinium_carterae.1
MQSTTKGAAVAALARQSDQGAENVDALPSDTSVQKIVGSLPLWQLQLAQDWRCISHPACECIAMSV